MNDAVAENLCTVRRTEPENRVSNPLSVSRAVRDRLVRFAYRFLWNLDEAEDAVQEALTVAHERSNDLRDVSKWWAWVCRIVIQRCRLRGRQNRRWARHAAPYLDEINRRALATTHDETTQLAEFVRRLLGELPTRQYEVIVLRHLQEMSFDEIGEVLDIAPSTARVHAQAGREALLKLVQENYGELHDV